MKKIILLLGCLSILTALEASSAERLNKFADPNTFVLVIPDLNGKDANCDSIARVLNISRLQVINIQTPLTNSDLGQQNCQQYLEATFFKNRNILLCATNEGCATAINYAAHGKCKNQIVGIICHGAVASGSEAICHRMRAEAPRTQALPFYPYTAPYLVKLFPAVISARSVRSFSVSGQQPIHSIQHIDPKIPIIFVPDKSVPIVDSYALMGARRIKRSRSINSYLVNPEEDQDQAIQACLKAEGIFVNNESLNELMGKNLVLGRNTNAAARAQDDGLFRPAHQEQLRRERIRTGLDYTLKTSLGLAAMYAAYKLAPTVKNAISSRVLVPA
jgi:hypothetical protein